MAAIVIHKTAQNAASSLFPETPGGQDSTPKSEPRPAVRQDVEKRDQRKDNAARGAYPRRVVLWSFCKLWALLASCPFFPC